jgi:hypothetical protein
LFDRNRRNEENDKNVIYFTTIAQAALQEALEDLIARGRYLDDENCADE